MQTICPFCGNVIINDNAARLASHVTSCAAIVYPFARPDDPRWPTLRESTA